MATGAVARNSRGMQEPDDLKAMEQLCKAGSQSPSAANLPHSSDDSSATVKLESCLKACSSPTSELLPDFTQQEAADKSQQPAASSPCQVAAVAGRSYSPVTPAADASVLQGNTESAGKQAAKAASGHQHTSLLSSEPLPAPDACEGPEVAAEYEAYMQRWAAGNTLAQRWARLEASGKAVLIREGWEEHQLDMLLQQHCSNTPQAAAARAAAAQAAARVPSQLGSPRGTRRSRADLELDMAAVAPAWDDGCSPAASPAGGRRVRSRQAPKSFRDFEVSLPTAGRSQSGAVSDDTVAAAAAGVTGAGDSAGGAGVFFAGNNIGTDGAQKQQQQQSPQDMDVYIGAGILLDLWSVSAAPAAQQEKKQQQQQPPQQQRQQGRKKVQKAQTPKPRAQQQQQQPQPPQPPQQQQQLLPAVQTKPKPVLVLDLSRSPRHSQASSGDDSPVTAGADASAAAAAAAINGVLSKPCSPQQLLLPPSGLHSPGALSVSRMAGPQQHLQLPPKPPKFSLSAAHLRGHHQQQQQVQAQAALPRQQQVLHLGAQQPQQSQQQQQQGSCVPPTYMQEALQVASQLGSVLGGDTEAFARVVSFVSQHSHQPAALYQFMSVSLSQLQQGKPAHEALEAAAAAGAAALAATAARAAAVAAQPSPSSVKSAQLYKVGLML